MSNAASDIASENDRYSFRFNVRVKKTKRRSGRDALPGDWDAREGERHSYKSSFIPKKKVHYWFAIKKGKRRTKRFRESI